MCFVILNTVLVSLVLMVFNAMSLFDERHVEKLLTMSDFTDHTWAIERVIIDQIQAVQFNFLGECEIVEGIYSESGETVLEDGSKLASSRRYIWQDSGETIDVSFEDKSFFHRIDLSKRSTNAVHFCALDTYKVYYDFTLWPNWSVTWDVEGPRKLYKMFSSYRSHVV